MVTIRALLLAVVLVAAPDMAGAQTGGIQVAPVLVSLSPQQTIDSVRMRNGRSRPVSFEVEAYAWTQVNGEDVLTRTSDLIVAPGVFEIPANGEQTIRIGARRQAATEQAYRILLRELPSEQHTGVALGFSLEMSLPIFMTPPGAAANVTSRVDGNNIVLTNTGSSYAQIRLVQNEQHLDAPRYLLAGSSATVELPAQQHAIQLIASGAGGQRNERTIDVGRSNQHASVR